MKSQKDETLLINKMKLLSKEEDKVSLKVKNSTKMQENMERIRVNEIKNRVEGTLSTWRDNLQEKNMEVAMETKNEQKALEEMIHSNKMSLSEKKRSLHDKVQLSKKEQEEKRRKEEYERKLKMKKELEEKINKEKELKQQYDDRINNYQEESIKIVQRINTLNFDNSRINTLNTSTSNRNLK